MCVDERCPHLYYYDDLLLLRLRLTTTPYSFSSPKHSPLLHASRPLFSKKSKEFSNFFSLENITFIRHTHTLLFSNGFSSLWTKDEANGGVERRGITPFGGGSGGKAEEEEEAKRVRPDRERRRRRNKESRSKAATEETARAFWIESVESHHQRV